MLVKIISGTYGHRPILPNGQKSHYVIPVRAGEAPIDVTEAEGERLIGLGVAEAVQAEKIKAPKQEPVEKAPEAENEGTRLEDMSFNELKALAQETGVDVSGIRSKSGLIEAINAAEEVPSFDAQDVVD